MRQPRSTLSSFSRRSCSSRSPQSPLRWRTRYASASSPDTLSASRAPGVATIEPGLNLVPDMTTFPLALTSGPASQPERLETIGGHSSSRSLVPSHLGSPVAIHENELLLGGRPASLNSRMPSERFWLITLL